VVTLIHGVIGTLYDVTETRDAEFDCNGILNIEVEEWEQVDSRNFQFSIISNYFISLEILLYEA